MTNLAPLRDALRWAEKQSLVPKEERQWRQQDWFDNEQLPKNVAVTEETSGFCGTTMCLAGKIVFDAGLVVTSAYGDPEIDAQRALELFPNIANGHSYQTYGSMDWDQVAEGVLDVPEGTFKDLWYTTMEGRNGVKAFREIENVALAIVDGLGETL